ncbi:MAG: YggT family protein [Gammaproteobacteria bacterium]
MSALREAAIFIITALFDLYILALLLRFLLQWVQANFYHPFCQFIAKITAPALAPLYKLIPRPQRIDWIILLLALMLEILKLFLLTLFTATMQPNLGGLMIVALGEIISALLTIYFYITLTYVLLSWIPLPQLLSLIQLLGRLVAPLLNPLRQYIPPFGGIDISPLILMLLLHIGSIIISNPLIQWGLTLNY